MKAEDLEVAVENARKKEGELEVAVKTFATYSQEYMKSREYAELLNILDIVIKPGFAPVLYDDKKTNTNLLFINSELEGVETPFSAKNVVSSTRNALSWKELVLNWAPRFSGQVIDDSSLAESFWKKFAENVNNRAYIYRMEHDEDFCQAEIARENAEYRQRNKEQSSRQWKIFFKICLIPVFVCALGLYFYLV